MEGVPRSVGPAERVTWEENSAALRGRDVRVDMIDAAALEQVTDIRRCARRDPPPSRGEGAKGAARIHPCIAVDPNRGVRRP
jgi:hypothetical protein